MDWENWYKRLTQRDKQKVLKAAELDLILDCAFILSAPKNIVIAFVLFFILLAVSILINVYYSFYVCLKSFIFYLKKRSKKE